MTFDSGKAKYYAVFEKKIEILQAENRELMAKNTSLAQRVKRVDQLMEDAYVGMPHGKLTHEQLAHKVRMLMRDDLVFESVITGARDRILYLAGLVADLQDSIAVGVPEGYKLLKNSTYAERSYDDTPDGVRDHCTMCQRPFEQSMDSQHWVCRVCSNEANAVRKEEVKELANSLVTATLGSTEPRAVDLFRHMAKGKLNPAQRHLEKLRAKRVASFAVKT